MSMRTEPGRDKGTPARRDTTTQLGDAPADTRSPAAARRRTLQVTLARLAGLRERDPVRPGTLILTGATGTAMLAAGSPVLLALSMSLIGIGAWGWVGLLLTASRHARDPVATARPFRARISRRLRPVRCSLGWALR